MTWPTISKGIFYEGYNKGMQESPQPGERDMHGPATQISGDSGVTHTRVVESTNGLTVENMRKPV